MAMIFLLHRSRGKWRVTCRLDWSRGTKLVNNAWSRRWKIKRSNTCALFTICKPNQFTSALSLYVQCPFRTWPTIILHNLPSFVSLSNIYTFANPPIHRSAIHSQKLVTFLSVYPLTSKSFKFSKHSFLTVSRMFSYFSLILSRIILFIRI